MPTLSVRIIVEGLHKFPVAVKQSQFQAVSYLAFSHHHHLLIEARIQVFHDDREIEFHLFRRWLISLYPDQPVEFGDMSCEAIARDLHAQVFAKYPGRKMSIRVNEDEWVGVQLDFDAHGDEVQ